MVCFFVFDSFMFIRGDLIQCIKFVKDSMLMHRPSSLSCRSNFSNKTTSNLQNLIPIIKSKFTGTKI